jgi:hypothetical protein
LAATINAVPIIKLLPINSYAPRYLPYMAVIIALAIELPIRVAKLITIKLSRYKHLG